LLFRRRKSNKVNYVPAYPEILYTYRQERVILSMHLRTLSLSCREALIAFAATTAFMLVSSPPALADQFLDDVARIDRALKKNPMGVPQAALLSCEGRRDSAIRLYEAGELVRANRSLQFCWRALGISQAAETKAVVVDAPPTMEELQARAAREVEQALLLTPNVENGLQIYRECAACHTPEGWGLASGSVPQLAGQHRKVVIKQLADIRAGHRDNVLMVPYATVEVIGGPQAVADVAGYVGTLEINVENGKGPGKDLEFGESLYQENCARCHGPTGAGDDDAVIPRIQAQHYNYLVRQFEAIRDGERCNADPEMISQIQAFEDRETNAVLDYVSRLEPPEDLQAPPDWKNPDFR
jgi:cytochrome c553